MPDEAEQKRLDTVHNERTKLSATYANGIAIAVFAVGGFAPIAAALSQGTVYTTTIILTVVCFAASGALHWVARQALGGMK